ncbi:hypothetical protein AVEN_121016-1 [Araneus ventricosus]|uniref:Uncharacterized protein n=1 Tax=Araneus ventricosus TaxID=182803 RepID=A0A4Y2UQK4_ARAVE|nr:hypothetical protein AVEN_121016-1 [Araneus ventricosus]
MLSKNFTMPFSPPFKTLASFTTDAICLASGKAVKRPERPKKAVRAGDKKRGRSAGRNLSLFTSTSLETGPPILVFPAKPFYHRFFRERHFQAHCSRIFPIITTTRGAQSPVGNPNSCEAFVAWQLAKHAVSEGTKAVTKYTSSK